MDIEELKAGWAELDRRLERVELAVRDTRRRGVRAELRPLVVGQAVQVVAGILWAVIAGSFWVGHLDMPNLLVTGLLLHAYGLAMVIGAARNLYLVARVDEGAPVLELQHRIAALRAWRIREGRWFGVVGCFMWVFLLIWAAGLAGVDIVAAQPLYVGLNVLVSLVCLGVFVMVTRSNKAPEGSAVKRAAERLAEIERFREL